ncbi:hypothetical protein EJB05_44379 [Eragrostis curvula]|uniref:Uncharacterized protein n=1 Tax=Eragrostis curvula TaxID=38414 RepID=A0A5J9THX5_9POAL|nr:hypothetical protein EJB05_44379 [Eragrostis curvula]
MSLKMSHAAKVVFLLFVLVVQGHSQGCDSKDIVVEQANVGRSNEMDFTFAVLIHNNCSCSISNLHVKTNGFSSSTPVDPSAFRLEGDTYLVNGGKPINSKNSFAFIYAFDRAFDLTPASWNVDRC